MVYYTSYNIVRPLHPTFQSLQANTVIGIPVAQLVTGTCYRYTLVALQVEAHKYLELPLGTHVRRQWWSLGSGFPEASIRLWGCRIDVPPTGCGTRRVLRRGGHGQDWSAAMTRLVFGFLIMGQ